MSEPMSRKEVSGLLPFLVNGTLEGAERAGVEKTVASDNALSAEVETLASLMKSVKAVEGATKSPGELGLKRLIADIDRMDTVTPSGIKAANVNSAPIWKLFGGYALAACIGALGLFVALPNFEQDEFAITASGDVMIDGPEITIAVTFSEGAVLVDVSKILRVEGLLIVDGPSARGVFQLADTNGNAPTIVQAERLRALTTLFATVDDPS